MPFTVKWLIEGRVCLITAPAIIDAAALRIYDVEMLGMLDSAPSAVCLIVDLRGMEKVASLTQIATLKHARHPRFKHAVTIGLTLNALARFFVPIVAQLFGIHYKDFNTMDEALAYSGEMEQA
jgi:hypothetical protein